MRFIFGRKYNEKVTNEENNKSDIPGMSHITVGRKYNTNKVANVECNKNNSLENIDIKGQCFLLIFLKSGSLTFCLNGKKSIFSAPTFICFDETENPKFISNDNADYYSQMFREEYRKYKFISFCSNRGGVEGFKISSMWAHYGNNHKGVCIEIDTDLLAYEGKIQSDYVDYTNDLTGGFFDVSDFYKTFDNNIKTILFSKSEEWGYEQEYRFVTKDFAYLDISNAITAIYCGCRMCNTHIKHIASFGYETKKMKLALLSRRLTDGLL